MAEKRCEVCNEDVAKYRCPRCSLRTCSLSCVIRHKDDINCNGVRDKTAYVNIKDFTEKNLLNDYRFLEDVDRKVDNIGRDHRHRHRVLPRHLTSLIQAARWRRTTLKILPFIFTKRKQNSTIWFYKQKEIRWHVEWIFPQSDVKYSDRRVSEKTLLRTLLQKYMHPADSDPIIRHRLKKYVARGFEDIRVVLKVERRMAKSTRYQILDLDKTLEENLAYKYIVEYPVMYVILLDYTKDYPILGEVQTECSGSSSETDSSSDSESNTSDSSRPDINDRGRTHNSSKSPQCDSLMEAKEPIACITNLGGNVPETAETGHLSQHEEDRDKLQHVNVCNGSSTVDDNDLPNVNMATESPELQSTVSLEEKSSINKESLKRERQCSVIDSRTEDLNAEGKQNELGRDAKRTKLIVCRGTDDGDAGKDCALEQDFTKVVEITTKENEPDVKITILESAKRKGIDNREVSKEHVMEHELAEEGLGASVYKEAAGDPVVIEVLDQRDGVPEGLGEGVYKEAAVDAVVIEKIDKWDGVDDSKDGPLEPGLEQDHTEDDLGATAKREAMVEVDMMEMAEKREGGNR